MWRRLSCLRKTSRLESLPHMAVVISAKEFLEIVSFVSADFFDA